MTVMDSEQEKHEIAIRLYQGSSTPVQAIADALGVSRQTIHRWIEDAGVPKRSEEGFTPISSEDYQLLVESSSDRKRWAAAREDIVAAINRMETSRDSITGSLGRIESRQTTFSEALQRIVGSEAQSVSLKEEILRLLQATNDGVNRNEAIATEVMRALGAQAELFAKAEGGREAMRNEYTSQVQGLRQRILTGFEQLASSQTEGAAERGILSQMATNALESIKVVEGRQSVLIDAAKSIGALERRIENGTEVFVTLTELIGNLTAKVDSLTREIALLRNPPTPDPPPQGSVIGINEGWRGRGVLVPPPTED